MVEVLVFVHRALELFFTLFQAQPIVDHFHLLIFQLLSLLSFAVFLVLFLVFLLLVVGIVRHLDKVGILGKEVNDVHQCKRR